MKKQNNTSLKNLLVLFGFVVVTFLIGGAGSIFTSASLDGWYDQIIKPSWVPPSFVFPIVWPILYGMMGVSAYIIWRKRDDGHSFCCSLVYYWVHVFFNFLWSYIFFGMRDIGLALSEIIVLWAMIGGLIIVFWRIDKVAGSLLIPYFAWVTFAMYLNYTIWQLNLGS